MYNQRVAERADLIENNYEECGGAVFVLSPFFAFLLYNYLKRGLFGAQQPVWCTNPFISSQETKIEEAYDNVKLNVENTS